mmetsp:Transcript_36046/g.111546  ORF Transcript_36046/g.111546 Transcript_36046/m.111546 type:complete len:253 (-) Transcript_36046:822-1580(-)
MRSATVLNADAVMVLRTVLTSDTFCAEPTARNSKRWPPYGNGDVRLRSCAGISIWRMPSTPMSSSLVLGLYSPPPAAYALRNSVMSSPKYVEMMAGGASQAPRRKSLPGDAMDMRRRSPCWSMADTMAERMTGNVSPEPDALAIWPMLRRLTPSNVPMDQLLCLPEPLTLLNGFSWRRAARPYCAAVSSMICITTRFWSICVVAVPKSGANSYWFGATSRWRVRSGMPRRKHWAWISCMHASAAVACDGGAM